MDDLQGQHGAAMECVQCPFPILQLQRLPVATPKEGIILVLRPFIWFAHLALLIFKPDWINPVPMAKNTSLRHSAMYLAKGISAVWITQFGRKHFSTDSARGVREWLWCERPIYKETTRETSWDEETSTIAPKCKARARIAETEGRVNLLRLFEAEERVPVYNFFLTSFALSTDNPRIYLFIRRDCRRSRVF